MTRNCEKKSNDLATKFLPLSNFFSVQSHKRKERPCKKGKLDTSKKNKED